MPSLLLAKMSAPASKLFSSTAAESLKICSSVKCAQAAMLAQARRYLQPPAVVGWRDERRECQAFPGLLAAEAFPPPLQPVERGVQLLLALAEEGDDLLALPGEEVLQRADPAAQTDRPFLVDRWQQEEGVDRRGQRFGELLAFVLDLAQELGGLAIERVVAQGALQELRGTVVVLEPEVDARRELEVRRTERVLEPGDVQALERPELLPFLGVEPGEPDEVGGVDAVAAHLGARVLDRIFRCWAALRPLQTANAGQSEAGAEIARLEAQSDPEELGGFIVELALRESARKRHEFTDIGRFRDGHRLSPAARSATMGKV